MEQSKKRLEAFNHLQAIHNLVANETSFSDENLKAKLKKSIEKKQDILEMTKEAKLDEAIEELKVLQKLVTTLTLNQNELPQIQNRPPQPQKRGPQADLEAIWNAAQSAAKVLWEQYTLQDLKVLPKKSKQPHSMFTKSKSAGSIWQPILDEQDPTFLIEKAVKDARQEALILALDLINSPTFSKKNKEDIELLNGVLDSLDQLKEFKKPEDITNSLKNINVLNNQLMQKVEKDEKWRPLASLFFRGLALACFSATAAFPPILLVGIYCIKLSRELSSPAPKTQKMHNLSVELNGLIETVGKIQPKEKPTMAKK